MYIRRLELRHYFKSPETHDGVVKRSLDDIEKYTKKNNKIPIL